MPEMRLFWAINLPPAIKSRLAGLQNELKSISCDAKWVEEKNLHFTVKFLGNVDVSLVTKLVVNMEAALDDCQPFFLELWGTGVFPNFRSPRVFWVGLKGEVDQLMQIQQRTEETHLSLGFSPEKQIFTPHLTLARLRSQHGIADLKQKINILEDRVLSLGHFKVTSIDLMQSELTKRGPIYTQVAQVKL
ncbi:MAG TPA: RNA 2',3'-cyclic phosphodiesterase [Desulfotomaculum sp.]|nr:RNA 2',3'-cyclic phosphodiesterase [Desulfotomaculum sp.]HCJ79028.1 RNA 2',3'-cyclic phosphodiesterase [Desulfotomaculum sp.]